MDKPADKAKKQMQSMGLSAPYIGSKETRTEEEVMQDRKTLAENVPILGEAMIAKEIADDVKDENYLSAGLNTLALGVGAIPSVGDILNKPIRAAAKKLRKVDEDAATKMLDDVDSIETWKKQNPNPKPQKQNPDVEKSANDLLEGKITGKQHRSVVKENMPIVKIDEVPEMPSFTEIVGALDKDKSAKGILGLNKSVKDGTRVSSRLDIPAYERFDKWVVSVHDAFDKKGKESLNGDIVGYGKTAVLRNVDFKGLPQGAANIAAKRNPKGTIARIFGDYYNAEPENVAEYAKKVIKDKNWTQVGYNPFRHGFFYDKDTGMPVKSAEEVIQVGPLVLAKNAQKIKISEAKQVGPKGGIKIRTGKPIEGLQNLKETKTVFNKGGAVPMNNMSKQMELFEPVERGFDEGGLMDEGGTVDPVSGNDVPPGSTQEEVRDDIPAQLSEGEFVFPADVVRYIGLENLMRMRQEAKQGLAQMDAMGQMGNSEEATVEDDLPFDMYDLDVEDDRNFNVGGYVAPTVPTNPYNQPGQVNPQTGTYTLPGTGIAGYQIPTGGQTGYTPYGGAAPYFKPIQFTGPQFQTALQTTNLPTFADTVGNNIGKYDELRTYVNDAGQIMQIPFKDGKPIYPIPEGYRPKGDQPTAEQPTTTTIPVSTPITNQGDGDGGGDGPGNVGLGSTSVRGSSDMETAMMDPSRGMFGTKDSSVGTFGSNREFGFSNEAMRSATFDMAKAQISSLSPMAAAGIQIGNQLGILDNMSTPNQDAIAGQTAKGMALSAMGFSNPGQISTNEQATAYGLAISAAMEASKKGQDVQAAVEAVMEQNKSAVQQGQASAMTAIGYNATDVSNQATVSRAVAGYNALADAYSQDAAEVAANGTVKDSKGNPVMSKSGPVMTQSSRDALNALESKAAQARAAAVALSNLEMNLDRSKSSGTTSYDASTGAPTDGFGPGTGGYSSEAAATAADEAEQAGGDTGPGGSGADHGADEAGSTGVGTGTDCLTEDMKVNLNGVIDFVTNIKVDDMIDNYRVKEVLHKHMRNGYYAINDELKISNDHPVLANGTWTRPEDLVVGDSINGIPVVSLDYIEQLTPTVSIIIDGESFDVHTENNIYTVHGRYREVRQEAA